MFDWSSSSDSAKGKRWAATSGVAGVAVARKEEVEVMEIAAVVVVVAGDESTGVGIGKSGGG